MNDFDVDNAQFFVSVRTEAVGELMHALTFLGSEPTLLVATLVLVGWCLFRQLYRQSAVITLGMFGAAVLTVGIKDLVQRARPPARFRLGPPDPSYSFPSGHTLTTTVFVILLVATLWPSLRVVGRRSAVVVAFLIAMGVGLSRLYLGYHWTTDVVASWFIAAAWSWVVLTRLSPLIDATLRRHSAGRPAAAVSTEPRPDDLSAAS